MSDYLVKGSCLCGEVSWEIKGHIGVFQNCHCTRCRKVSGAMHASNLFVGPDDFSWLSGEQLISHYELPTAKYFSNSFCSKCGSRLPHLAKTGKVVVVPAGSLDQDPQIKPDKNIHFASKASWFHDVTALPSFDELPPRK